MKYKIYLFVFLAVIVAACEDVLDKRNLNAVDDNIWNDYETAQLYVNSLYVSNMPGMSLGSFSGYSDESYTSDESVTKFLYGLVENSEVSSVNDFSVTTYQLIRTINIAINGLNNGSLDEEGKQLLLGQAYFFRAWRYWELVKLYGGVPMILTPQDPFYDNLDMPRNTTKECIELIVADLDAAISGLPASWIMSDDMGRITRVAAAAFKGRVLLAWASPMFNPMNDPARWNQAYDANLYAKELAEEVSYGLNPSFENIFTDNPNDNVEAILYRSYDGTPEFSNGWEGSIRPISGGGSKNNMPTWNLVQAFPMADGKAITNTGSGYDPVHYWRNRDPRFYYTIGYNGCVWTMAGKEGDIVWSYDKAVTENRNTPSSGFYCRKASNPEIDYDDVSQTSTAWLEIRYAEIILNLAECANEINKPDDAISLIGMIRDRAGIPSDDNYGLGTGLDQSKVREAVMVERQIEFAFENKRYWDLRRRKMFTEDLGNNITKLNGSKRMGLYIAGEGVWNSRVTSGEYRGWTRLDTAVYLGYVDIENPGDYETYFNVSEKELDGTTIIGTDAFFNYQEFYYFFAIPSGALEKGDAVEQTLGWENGSFDPLAE